jgi:hypothetical protein
MGKIFKENTMRIVGLAILILMMSMIFASNESYSAVTSYQSTSKSTIMRYENGTLAENAATEQTYPTTTSTIPVQVTQSMNDNSSNQTTTWAAFNRVMTNEPQYNAAVPQDFVMETAVGSSNKYVGFDVSSTGIQKRTIQVLESEVEGSSAGDTVTLNSKFSLEGALVGVVPMSATTASGLEMSMTWGIKKGSESVWEGTVNLTGNSDGTMIASPSGDFTGEEYSIMMIDTNEMNVWLVYFTGEVPYSYSATVGETFDLTAEMDLEYKVPGGYGAGCAFGTVPAQMILTADQLFGQPQPPSLIASPAPEPMSLLLFFAGMMTLRYAKRRS